ncbi:WD40-repeat-containing domain protein [Powellomyces hirtus]|nr:WD40-repeat-containing domain protein [Powellomyces hirtus]
MTSLSALPTELHLQIASHLEVHTFFLLARTCRCLRTALNGCDVTWARLCKELWRDLDGVSRPPFDEEGDDTTNGWREFFCSRARKDNDAASGRAEIRNLRKRTAYGEIQIYDGRTIIKGSTDGQMSRTLMRGSEKIGAMHSSVSGAILCLQAHCGIIAAGWQHRESSRRDQPPSGQITLFDVRDLQPIAVLTATSLSGVTAVRFNTHRLVAGDRSGVLRSWRLASRGQGGWLEKSIWRGTIQSHYHGVGGADPILDVQFTYSHALARTCKSLEIYCLRTGTTVFTLAGDSSFLSGQISACHLHSTSVAVAFGSGLHIHAYRDSYRRGSKVISHSSTVRCLQFADNDDEIIVSGDDAGCVRVWDVKTASRKEIYDLGTAICALQARRTMKGHLFIVALCTDGRLHIVGEDEAKIDAPPAGERIRELVHILCTTWGMPRVPTWGSARLTHMATY